MSASSTSSPATRRPRWELDLVATAGLALFSFAVALGFARVFSGWQFLVDMALLIVIGHGLSYALRRLEVSGFLVVPFVSAVLLWALINQHYGDTMSWLLPTGETRDLVRLEVGLVRDQFQTAVAPVLYGAGWATLAGFALIVAIVMSDSFAFRADARGEALVPGGVLFIFIAALGSSRLRIESTGLLIAVGVLAVVGLRSMHDRSRRVELRAPGSRGSMMLPTAIGTAVALAVLAGVVGPRIPGAQAEPLYETRGRGGGVTSVVSPLVDIRSRLTNRGNVELFRVNADAPAYWRATTLPVFDGSTFQLPRRPLEGVDGEFDTADSGTQRIRQQIQVLDLGGKLLPAAADPVAADGTADLQLNRDTTTLLAPDDLAPGDLFTVESAAPRFQPDRLRSATTSGPPDPIFVEVPDDLPDIVTVTASEITAGTSTSYDAAIALQQWFRTDFDYSLEVQQGHGNSAIESFLLEKVGYCEQFSATFAAMARTLGIPSRVAVGFTPGVLNDEGWYSVLGKNAHAWPELWFDGLGWVAFEPTPGRGAPGAESYTGVQPDQDDSPAAAGGGGDEGAAPAPTTPSTVVPPPTTAAGDPSETTPVEPGSNLPEEPISPGGDPGSADGLPVASQDDSGIPWRPLIAFGLLIAVLAGPWLVRRARTGVRRALSPEDRVHMAWIGATDAATRAGVGGSPSMTAHEWAAATAAELPVAARPMRSLADAVNVVSFAPAGRADFERSGTYGSTLDRDCELWSEQVTRIADDTLTTPQRIHRYFTSW